MKPLEAFVIQKILITIISGWQKNSDIKVTWKPGKNIDQISKEVYFENN